MKKKNRLRRLLAYYSKCLLMVLFPNSNGGNKF